jgi:hypothetical protein
LVFREPVTSRSLGGGALVLVGVALAGRGQRPRASARRNDVERA